MFIFFTFFTFVFADVSNGRTIAWSVSWGLECIIAYFLHRRITFRYDGAVASSFIRTMLVYGVALIGSTVTYHFLDYEMDIPYLVAWLSNGIFWGIFNFLALRRFAMHQPVDESANQITNVL